MSRHGRASPSLPRSQIDTPSFSHPIIQAFKFALYVTIPAVLTFVVATNADVLNVIIKQVSKNGERGAGT